jgi:hypothetical protein
MAGRFDLPDFANALSKFQVPEAKLPSAPLPDKRSRAERREDFEKELAALDKDALIELRKKIQDIDEYSETYKSDFWAYKEDLENSIIKLIRYMNKFEELNSNESRKITLKEQELKLEARHDWAEKFRLFFFRVLATALFVGSLFAIGYLEHNYEWAKLPLSKYVKTTPAAPEK